MQKLFIALFAFNFILVSCKDDTLANKSEEIDKEIAFNLPDGFILEDLYQPSENEQGSWVAMAQGPNDIIYACDQYGKIYYFNAPEIDQTLKPEDVMPLDLEIGEAHAISGHLIQIWRLDVFGTKRPNVSVAHVVNEYYYDVWKRNVTNVGLNIHAEIIFGPFELSIRGLFTYRNGGIG